MLLEKSPLFLQASEQSCGPQSQTLSTHKGQLVAVCEAKAKDTSFTNKEACQKHILETFLFDKEEGCTKSLDCHRDES